MLKFYEFYGPMVVFFKKEGELSIRASHRRWSRCARSENSRCGREDVVSRKCHFQLVGRRERAAQNRYDSGRRAKHPRVAVPSQICMSCSMLEKEANLIDCYPESSNTTVVYYYHDFAWRGVFT